MPNRFHLAASVGQHRASWPCQISLSTFLPVRGGSEVVLQGTWSAQGLQHSPERGWKVRNPAGSKHDSLVAQSPFVIHFAGGPLNLQSHLYPTEEI